jgi:hypothetical protein
MGLPGNNTSWRVVRLTLRLGMPKVGEPCGDRRKGVFMKKTIFVAILVAVCIMTAASCNAAPVFSNPTVSPATLCADGSTQYTVRYTATDASGIKCMLLIFDSDGGHGFGRGGLSWASISGYESAYNATSRGAATGGGYWGVRTDYGPGNINPVSCTASGSSAARTVTWTFKVTTSWPSTTASFFAMYAESLGGGSTGWSYTNAAPFNSTFAVNSIPVNKTVTTQNSSVYPGFSTSIQVAGSETGVSYQLKTEAGVTVGAPVMGTGSTINLPTGNLTQNTQFKVDAIHLPCFVVTMTNHPTVTIGQPPAAVSIGEAKRLAEGSALYMTGKVVSASYNGFFYIEEENRSCGIKVIGSAQAGATVSLEGTVSAASGEKTITASSMGGQSGGTIPKPLGVNIRSAHSSGLSPVGLYVSVWGKVSSVTGGGYTVTDGSNQSLKVHASTGYAGLVDDYVAITGALGSEMSGSAVVPVMRAKSVVLLKSGPKDPQWLQFRRDRTLTGRSPLKSNITSPTIKWQQFVGARETLIGVRFDGSQPGATPLPSADLGQYDATLRSWEISGPWYDLDNNGNFTPIGPDRSYKIGKFTADNGLQKVVSDSQFAGDPSSLHVRLFKRVNGAWSQSWQSEHVPELFVGNPLVADFDNDGRLEAAVTAWYNVWVFDMATGATKYKCYYMPSGAESGRGYGWFGASDINGDGKQEFVVMADFENHVDVLGWNAGGQLVRLWGRLIERGIIDKKTTLWSTTNPVQDVDGDGQKEVLVSIYNETGDNRWHMQVLNGMTGQVKLDLTDQCLTGVCDVEGDGVPEMFCTSGSAQSAPEVGDLSVLSFNGGSLQTIWQNGTDSSFQRQNLTDFPLTANSNAASGRMALLAGPVVSGGLPVFFTRKTVDALTSMTEVTAWQYGGGQIAQLGSLTGPGLEALAVRQAPAGGEGVLMHSQVPGDVPSSLDRSGAATTWTASRRNGAPNSAVAVGRLQSELTVVVQGANETLTAFVPPKNGSPAQTRWNAAGRGMYNGSYLGGEWSFYGGVVLADVLGDGRLDTIAATRAPNGSARLVALSPQGDQIWSHDFIEFPGAPPDWNIGGLCQWFAGSFTDPNREDILVCLRRSTMHSEECYMLDGRTGETIWHRTEGGHYQPGLTRGYGGAWQAVFDYDNDGLDDALLYMPDLVFVVDGATGSVLLDRTTCYDLFGTNVWTIGAYPVVGDFLGNGQKQFLYAGNPYLLGLLASNGNPLWQTGVQTGLSNCVIQCVGDVDGDGQLEIMAPGARPVGLVGYVECRCYSAATGALKWTVNVPAGDSSVTSPCIVDIDGDGREECIFGSGWTEYCVGADPGGASGRIEWSINLPGYLGPPTITDFTNSGNAQVVVSCGDGYVYGIGQ